MVAGLMVSDASFANAECRRVCRAGEVRNAQRCCVPRRRSVRKRRPGRLSLAAACLRRRDPDACARWGLRLAKAKRYKLANKFLTRGCAPGGGPLSQRPAACLELGRLVYHGHITHAGRGNRHRHAKWIVNRVCGRRDRPAVCADQDKDNIRDLFDLCPRIKEDVDGYKDHDGCPDKDNDQDKVPDNKDACPHMWAATSSGCPKVGIRVGNPFQFLAQSASLNPADPTNAKRLAALVDMIKRNPGLPQLEVRGHSTPNETRDRAGKRISSRRAKFVARQLLAKGVPAKRLRVFGYGARIYDSSLVDVIVAEPMYNTLTKGQLARGMKVLNSYADICRNSNSRGAGRGVYTFWIRADGSIERSTIRISGTLAGTPRAGCIKHRLKKYLFPRSKTKRTKAVFVVEIK